jgi:hypothetical protein
MAAKAVRKSARVLELEAKLNAALEAVDRQSQYASTLAAQLGTSRAAPMTGALLVGIRNISNYTIGLIDTTNGQRTEYNLHAERPGFPDPQSRAVVPYAYWQQLRMGTQVAKGMIMRDEAVLGPSEYAAPADAPTQIHPDFYLNAIPNAREWILSHTEEEMRTAISRMTSEPSLRRLLAAVDTEIWNIGEERFLNDEDRPSKAIRALPGVFRLAESLAEERLDELNPVAAVRHQEVTRLAK